MTNNIEKALTAKGIDLPTPAAPVASYVPAVEVNGMLHISGQVSMHDGQLITGRLAVGVGSLPLGVAVEVDAIVAVKPE